MTVSLWQHHATLLHKLTACGLIMRIKTKAHQGSQVKRSDICVSTLRHAHAHAHNHTHIWYNTYIYIYICYIGACVYASGQVYVYAYGICICICKRLSVCNIMQRDKTIIIINVWHIYFWQAITFTVSYGMTSQRARNPFLSKRSRARAACQCVAAFATIQFP